jgi:hypothetical protein
MTSSVSGGPQPGQKAMSNSIPVHIASDSCLAPLSVTIEAGEVEGELPVLAPIDDNYRPATLSELVRCTPDDIIRKVTEDLGGKASQGKPIEPLPKECEWFQGAPLKSDVLYTLIRQIVHRELERFAQRVERHYILVPREPGDT